MTVLLSSETRILLSLSSASFDSASILTVNSCFKMAPQAPVVTSKRQERDNTEAAFVQWLSWSITSSSWSHVLRNPALQGDTVGFGL